MKYVWSFMIVFSIIVAFFTGNVGAMNEAFFERAAAGAAWALGLAGVMTLWLGLMKIAESAGLNIILAKALKPVTKRLFPSIPPESPAMGSIVFALAALALGLVDAATPLSIKAVKDMHEYNPHKDYVSDDQAVFVAMAISNMAIITPAVLAVRVAANSANPTEIIGPTIIATTLTTVFNVVIVKRFAKLKAYRLPDLPTTNTKDNV